MERKVYDKALEHGYAHAQEVLDSMEGREFLHDLQGDRDATTLMGLPMRRRSAQKAVQKIAVDPDIQPTQV